MTDESTSTSLGLSSLPKLPKDATSVDFLEFEIKFNAYGRAKGWEKGLRPIAGLLTDTQAETSTDKDKLLDRKRNDDAVAALALAALNTSTLSIFTASKSIDHSQGIASEIWAGLAQEYAPTDDLSEVEMMQDLSEVKMKKGEDPKTLFEQIDVIKARYSGTVNIPESSLIAVVVKKAPAEYQSTILIEKQKPGVTLKKIKTAMNLLYRALDVSKGNESDDDKEDNKNELQLGSFDGNCHICGEKGHKQYKCPKKSKGKGGGRGKKKVKCYHCGKTGHIKKKCWILHPELKPKSGGEASGAAVGNSNELLISSIEGALGGDICLECVSESIDVDSDKSISRAVDMLRNGASWALIEGVEDEEVEGIATEVGNETDTHVTAGIDGNPNTEADDADGIAANVENGIVNNISIVDETIEVGDEADTKIAGGRIQHLETVLRAVLRLDEEKDKEPTDMESSNNNATTEVVCGEDDTSIVSIIDESGTGTIEVPSKGDGTATIELSVEHNVSTEFALAKIQKISFPAKLGLLQSISIWLADSGASMHSTGHKDGLTNLRSADIVATGITGSAVATKQVGDMHGTNCNKYGERLQNIHVTEIGYNPQNNFNLFSLTRCLKEGWVLGGDKDSIWLEKNGKKLVFDIIIDTDKGRVYAMCINRHVQETTAAAPTGAGKSFTIAKAHGLLGHKNNEDVRKTSKALDWTIKSGALGPCEDCTKGKAKQKNVIQVSESKPSADRVFLDISSLKPAKNKDGIIDNTVVRCTHPHWRILVTQKEQLKNSTFHKKKSDMVEPTCIQFKRMDQAGRGVRFLRMDNAGENKTLQQRINSADWQLGIDVELTARNTPQHNALAELGFASIAPLGRSMLSAANVPRKYRHHLFPLVMSCATKLDGLVVIDNDGEPKTRYVSRLGKNPKWSQYLRTWGEAATVTYKSKATSKVDDRGKVMMFADYADNHDGDTYVFWHEATRRTVISRDAIWLHRWYFEKPQQTGELLIEDDLEISVPTSEDATLSAEDLAQYEAREGEDYDDVNELTSNEPDTNANAPEQQVEPEQEQAPTQTGHATRQASGVPIRAATRLIEQIGVGLSTSEESMYKELLAATSATEYEEHSDFAEIACVGAGIIGGGVENTENLRSMKYGEAMRLLDPVKVKVAVEEEYNRMVTKNVFERKKRSEVPKDAKILSTIWAIRMKASGDIRARICARGYEQVDGEHYDSTSIAAPVTSWFIIRLVFILTLMMNGVIRVQDVCGAFLLGEFQDGETMYIEIPEGFEEYYEADEVLLLRFTLYGTKNAAMAFFRKLVSTNNEPTVGLLQSKVDPCLFYKWKADKLVLSTSWVDDECYGGNKDLVEQTMSAFNDILECEDQGDIKEYVGCKVDHNRATSTIKITQPVLIQSLQDRFPFAKTNRFIRTPAVGGSVLTRPKEDDEVISAKEQSEYRSAQGILQYIVSCSRPECANSVRETARQNAGATPTAQQQVQRAVQHIVCTPERGLLLKPKRKWNGNRKFKFIISGTSDSNWATCPDDRRSISGWATYLEGAMLNSKSSTQKSVGISITETEINSATSCAQDMVYAKRVVESVGLEVELPMILRCDNKGAVDLINNLSVGGRTRHMDTKVHWLRELKADGILIIVWIAGDENETDILTKNVDGPLFEKHSSNWVSDEDVMNTG